MRFSRLQKVNQVKLPRARGGGGSSYIYSHPPPSPLIPTHTRKGGEKRGELESERARVLVPRSRGCRRSERRNFRASARGGKLDFWKCKNPAGPRRFAEVSRLIARATCAGVQFFIIRPCARARVAGRARTRVKKGMNLIEGEQRAVAELVRKA